MTDAAHKLSILRRRPVSRCRQFDKVAFVCPSRRHCYACDEHRRYRLGPLKFHLEWRHKYWERDDYDDFLPRPSAMRGLAKGMPEGKPAEDYIVEARGNVPT